MPRSGIGPGEEAVAIGPESAVAPTGIPDSHLRHPRLDTPAHEWYAGGNWSYPDTSLGEPQAEMAGHAPADPGT